MSDQKPTVFDLSYYEYKCKDSIADIVFFLEDINVNKNKLYKLEPCLEYSYSQIEDLVGTYDKKIIIDVVTKIDWLLDTSIQWRSSQSEDLFETYDNSLMVNRLFGKRLSNLIKYFNLSPLESIDISWSQIFAITALQQCSLLYRYHFRSDEIERLSLNHIGSTPTSLCIDIADCTAKSAIFHQLLDEKWVNTYRARKAAYSKVKKALPLKKEVIKRFHERYSDTDKSSAGLAILLELQQENSDLLEVLLKDSKMERTFTTWIKESEEKPDISTFF